MVYTTYACACGLNDVVYVFLMQIILANTCYATLGIICSRALFVTLMQGLSPMINFVVYT